MIQEFEAMSKIWNVIGFFYTMHILTIVPKINITPYFNKWHVEHN